MVHSRNSKTSAEPQTHKAANLSVTEISSEDDINSTPNPSYTCTPVVPISRHTKQCKHLRDRRSSVLRIISQRNNPEVGRLRVNVSFICLFIYGPRTHEVSCATRHEEIHGGWNARLHKILISTTEGWNDQLQALTSLTPH